CCPDRHRTWCQPPGSSSRRYVQLSRNRSSDPCVAFQSNKGALTLKVIILPAALALALVAGVSGSANAKGCLAGAAAGGVAGHMAGHGVLGAAGGCAVGHHMASEEGKEAQ